jgi:hypothetical protein
MKIISRIRLRNINDLVIDDNNIIIAITYKEIYIYNTRRT